MPRPAVVASPEATLIEPGQELVAGRRPVEEAFAARREAVRLLIVPQRRQALQALVLHATTLRLPVAEVEGGTLTAMAGFDGHQGVALVTAARRWASVEDVAARAVTRGERPFILVLDSLEDPHNVGSLLRTAEATGVHGVLFPTHGAAPLTASAIKASAGAVEHLLLVPVDDLARALADLRARGLRLVGADAEAALGYREADYHGPLALVVGSEGRGLSGVVRRRLDQLVRIPMRGRIASLNAAVAGSVLLLEAAGQREEGQPANGQRVSDVGGTAAPDPGAAGSADQPPEQKGQGSVAGAPGLDQEGPAIGPAVGPDGAATQDAARDDGDEPHLLP
ncbi:MAG: 23S rRNA (guanosine(2251)-2'-O)-methyltransferase RlmB [Candidatus Limnocylindrales bacterium]